MHLLYPRKNTLAMRLPLGEGKGEAERVWGGPESCLVSDHTVSILLSQTLGVYKSEARRQNDPKGRIKTVLEMNSFRLRGHVAYL